MRSVAIFVVVTVFVVLFFVRHEPVSEDQPGRSLETGERKSRIAHQDIRDEISTSLAKTESRTVVRQKRDWNSFSKLYGENLTPSFHSNGKVVSIRGEFGKGIPASYDFNPMIESLVEKRVNEIMESLKEISTLPDGGDLSIPTIRTGPVSAQVFYKQKIGGYPVYPSGDIKVDIGPKGELLGFYSDYEPNLNVTNGFTIDHDSAEGKIRNLGYINDRPGRRIIWSSGKEGRSAYEFYAEGKQIIVDADNLNILTTRDRKVF